MKKHVINKIPKKRMIHNVWINVSYKRIKYGLLKILDMWVKVIMEALMKKL
jgi:hypothetical protein